MTTEMAHALIGSVLDGSYRIEGLLGEGGMGAVYAATHLRLEKVVAVKVMARELTANSEALARFRREALVTSGLGHPHIVQVFDCSTTPTGEPFLVMEFLDGEDLDRRLRRVGRLPAADVVRIVRQVASALMATHNKGIIHRDLKPANVYLLEIAGETDFVKVLDFGISKVRSATLKLTRTTAIMGTPGYMSPEQARGNADEIDERTDQWALACIAWECLCGEVPFGGENLPSILFKIVHEPPPALLPKVPELHPQVEEVLLRALAKNKNDRFASVNDFAVALEAALTGAASKLAPGVPRTILLSQTTVGTGQAEKLLDVTTFTRTAGELNEETELEDVRSKSWIWAVSVGAAAILVVGALVFFRSGSAPLPVRATVPAATVVLPTTPVVPIPAPAPVPAPVPAPAPAAAEPEPPVVIPPSKEKRAAKKPEQEELAPAVAEPRPAHSPAHRPRPGRRMIEDL